eukprot:m.286320 g.286320  ORF g.286320 m.286320 type:complete len:158 (-) comp54986_c0_seq6:253-726(-)
MGDLIIEWNALSPNGRPYLDFLGVFVHALVRPFVCVVVPDLSCSCWCFLVAFSLFLCVPLVSMCVVLQIVWPTEKGEDDEPNMVEIGPRFVLNPIRVFEGCFGGPTLYANEEYISPNLVRYRSSDIKLSMEGISFVALVWSHPYDDILVEWSDIGVV